MPCIRRLALPLMLATFAGAPAALANSVVGLAEGRTLVTFDPATLQATGVAEITGAGPLVGIDLRPADGKLYGVGADGQVYTLDPASGAATPVVRLQTMLPAGVAATVDFNPVADRLRLIGSDGTNLRANLADGAVTVDGALAYADGDMHRGEQPNIVAGAYTNSVAGSKETALYDLDATLDALVKQAPPNDGVLNAVGKLGVAAEGAAFDIATDAEGRNRAWLVAGGVLHAVDLETGMATVIGPVEGLPAISDLAVLPR
jgi:hypothetical protein